jgi:AcrR family transcriptional regulator
MTRPAGRSRTKLDERRIVEAALQLSDSQEGLRALTLRSLADHLGVATMTLYGYFRNKEELLDAMANHVLGGFVLPPLEDEEPESAIRTAAEGMFRLLTTHPSVAELLSTRTTRTHASMKGTMESVLTRMSAAGLPGPIAVRCFAFIVHYAIGFTHYRAPRPWGAAPSPETDELRRQQAHFYAGLPRHDFPFMVEHAEELVMLPTEEMYDFAIDALVDHVLKLVPA